MSPTRLLKFLLALLLTAASGYASPREITFLIHGGIDGCYKFKPGEYFALYSRLPGDPKVTKVVAPHARLIQLLDPMEADQCGCSAETAHRMIFDLSDKEFEDLSSAPLNARGFTLPEASSLPKPSPSPPPTSCPTTKTRTGLITNRCALAH